MRLIDVHTLEINEFFEDNIPEYAALSHTWGFEEASLQQWTQHSNPADSTKRGFVKTVSACRLARHEGFRHLWVDTVCIDKTSAVDVTEAINSMFQWYRDAKVCYAYLEDMEHQSSANEIHQLRTCRWFTRGWTVQELIAPCIVKFCDRTWSIIGTKSALAKEIASITSISEKVLHDSREVMRQSIAQRMSWFAKRQTTRKEDIAYCTMGVFDVNMPAVYGEGKKAFIRLQEEIIKVTNDRTIFCWTWPDTIPVPTWIPCLAPHPSAFRDSGQYVPDRRAQWQDVIGPSVTNNVGIQTHLRVASSAPEAYFGVLDVTRADDPSGHRVAIPMARLTSRSPSESESEPVWRAHYPASPIRLPSDWRWEFRDLCLARPGLEPINGDVIPGESTSPQDWPLEKVSPFATMVLQCVDSEKQMTAHVVQGNKSCFPLLFFKPTRSPRVWHQSVRIHTRRGDYMIYMAVWLLPDGGVSWRASLDALEPHAPLSVLEKQVASWGSKVEFRVSGSEGVDGVACLEFGEDGMDLVQDRLGPVERMVVRPASFNVYLPRRRALLE